ncbi:MAG: hypothetical protein KAQ98_02285 [Bacteriovoracaceae bacterium]|nr:hypothetical protein [Bacteriovoracaceae bacterium]
MKKKFLLSIVAVTIFLQGCAGFRTEKFDLLKPWAKAKVGTRKIPIVYSVNFKSIINGKATVLNKKSKKKVSGIIRQAMVDTGKFEINSPNPKFRLEFDIINHGKYSFPWSFVSGFTFGLIPARATDRFEINLKVVNKKGSLVKTTKKEDKVDTWTQTLLIFATPFMWPFSQVDNAIYDTARASLNSVFK